MTRRHKYLYLELIVSKTTYTYIHKHNAHNVHVTNRKKNMKWNPSQRTHTHTHTTNSLIGRYMMYHIISPFDAEHFCRLIVLHHIQCRTTVDYFFVCWTPTIMARHAYDGNILLITTQKEKVPPEIDCVQLFLRHVLSLEVKQQCIFRTGKYIICSTVRRNNDVCYTTTMFYCKKGHMS